MGPLNGIRALDLARGPALYCTKLLADLGADVVKVEPPEGAPDRREGPFLHGDPGLSLTFLHYNRNKRSITLRVDCPDGRALFGRLLEGADVLLEDWFPPGSGLGYEECRAWNDRLIHASISPFGSTGPRAGWKGADLVAQAMGGIMYRVGFVEDPPASMGAGFAHHQASGHAAAGILTALLGRGATGTGRHVDVSMQESISLMQYDALPTYVTRGVLIKRAGHGQGSSGKRYRRIWECREGLVRFQLISQSSEREWPLLVKWLDSYGMAGGLKEERWKEAGEREAHLPELEEAVGAFFLTLEARRLMEEGQGRGIMIMAFNSVGDLVRDRQLAEEGFFREVEYGGETLTEVGPPYRFWGTPVEERLPAPALGAHNREVYVDELGLTEVELMRLKESGVV